MSREDVAALAGMSTDTLDRAVNDLVKLGLVAKGRGKWNGVTRWQVAATSGLEVPPTAESLPPRAAAATATSGLSRARVGTTLEEGEEEKMAPDGAALSPTDDNATGEETDALLGLCADVVEEVNDLRPEPSARDRKAARKLLGRLGPNWEERLETILRAGLADPFWAQHVVSVAGLERHLDTVLGLAKTAKARCGCCRGNPLLVGPLNDEGFCESTCADLDDEERQELRLGLSSG
jgi:hypothetical protein